MNEYRVPKPYAMQSDELLQKFITPALILDLEVFDRNIRAIEDMARISGKLIRPHVKTHRTSGLALRQLGPTAIGVTCATVGEAETMVEAGIPEVLLANEIVSARKIERMATLARRTRILVAVDAAEQVLGFSQAAVRSRVVLDVLIDLEIGLGRCGIRNAKEAIELAGVIDSAPSLRLVGIMGYEGRLRKQTGDRCKRVFHAFTTLSEAKSELQAAGFAVEIVSAAGTSTLREALQCPDITEIQAGSYALMESDLEGLGLPFEYALSVMSTVISRSDGVVVVDAGRKTLGCEYGLPTPLDDHARALSISEEHLVLEWYGILPALGKQIALRPSQVRTTFNLHDRVWLLYDDQIVDCLTVDARGCSQ